MIDSSDNLSSVAPICSVCIANFNGIELIEDCLNSVLAQDCVFSFEIIVHDDASSDGSVNVVCERYPDVIVIQSDENVGFCVSNNRMVARARGEYILLLNNDAQLFPDALDCLMTEAERIGKPAILGLPQYDHHTGTLIDIGSLCDPFLNPIPNLNIARREVAMVSGACLWIPRSLWERLGGFPDWFGSLAEDLYLCSLTRLYGFNVSTVTTSGFRHRVGHSLGGGRVISGELSTTYRRRILSERNKTYVLVLSYPAPLFQIVLPIHFVMLLVEGLLLSLIKRNPKIFYTIYLAVIRDTWRERRHLLASRREFQSHRLIGVFKFFSVFIIFPYKLLLLFKYGIPKIR
jgi:GT2 family glycosyltransferase